MKKKNTKKKNAALFDPTLGKFAWWLVIAAYTVQREEL